MVAECTRRPLAAILVSILVSMLMNPGRAASAVPPGVYAGWAYVDGGGDFPLRLEIEGDTVSPSVRFSLPHSGSYGLATENVSLEADGLQFERVNTEGKRWRYSASQAADTLAGEAVLEGDAARFTFELHRSHEPLAMRKLENHTEYEGTYRGNGRTLVISAWFWGELRYFDIKSGRTGTLFQSADGSFFAGAANYVPHPVFARIQFHRNADGAVTSLTWSQDGYPPARRERVRFQEHEVTVDSDGAQLKGTLVTPTGDGPFPLVIVMGGSNWQTREQVRNEAAIFVSFGIAAFIYDQRGFGESTGDQVCSFAQTSRDACAAIDALGKRPDVDAHRIGLFGVSRGGWLAPLAASQCQGRVSFLVLFVAPAVSPAEQETTRRLNEMRRAGFADAEVQEAAEYLKLLFDATQSDAAWAMYERALEQLRDREWLDIAGRYDKRDDDDYRWTQLNMHYDPTPALESVRCPVLALFGERDSNVTPEQNVRLMQTALRHAGNEDVTLTVLPLADHGLRPVNPGTSVPLHRTTGYVPDVWTTARDWLSKHAVIRSDDDSAP